MEKLIPKMFEKSGLPNVIETKKIDIGWSNKVYRVNGVYIIKICEDKSNEPNFEREVNFYRYFDNVIPVPKIICFDQSMEICKFSYMIYHFIEGDNLYSKWHLLDDAKRKNVVKQLCEILSIVRDSYSENLAKLFKLTYRVKWKKHILTKIESSLSIISNKRILSPEIIKLIKAFIRDHQSVLDEQKLGLVYWDSHFDNILIKNGRIVALLDFERTEFSSIDYSLDIIRRMQEWPTKYMAEKWEKFAKKEDYKNLMKWYEIFSPEVFQFENLETRLDFYSLERGLDTLCLWHNSKREKEAIYKIIGYKEGK